ncbi:hypothetical protein F5Y02DRAFT_262626 [Annulohypoxylon stygium]|nr:hypothetical protein F5Y02DRAFT_262626 [Annulohypoxylon stygium]
MADQLAGDDSFRTQTIVWPASTFVTTWTLGGGNYAPTETPATVIPAGNPGPTDNQNVGPILSAVVVALVLALILWFCCRRKRSNGRYSRRSSRRQSSSYASKGSSGGSSSSNSSSRNDGSVGSAASEIGEDQWDQQEPMPEGPMPTMPPPAAGGWLAGQPGPGMNFPPGHGGPPMMMGRGGPPPLGRGGPPPMMGRGGPPPGVM